MVSGRTFGEGRVGPPPPTYHFAHVYSCRRRSDSGGHFRPSVRRLDMIGRVAVVDCWALRLPMIIPPVFPQPPIFRGLVVVIPRWN